MKTELSDDLEVRLKKCDDLWQRRFDHKEKTLQSIHKYEVNVMQYHESITIYKIFRVFQIKKYEERIAHLMERNNVLTDQIRGLQTAVPLSDVTEMPEGFASMIASTLEPPNKRRRSH